MDNGSIPVGMLQKTGLGEWEIEMGGKSDQRSFFHKSFRILGVNQERRVNSNHPFIAI